MSIAKGSDDLWVAVICQSNPEIACSPRNSFRASVRSDRAGGRALIGVGPVKGTEPSQTPNTGMGFRAVGPRGMSSVVERGTTQTIG